nr:hypothetical protein [Tanacetum cinerariifolium]
MLVQNPMGKGSALPTDPQHTPTILQSSSSQPQKTQKPKKPKRKNTQVPQPSGSIKHVIDKAVHKELRDSLVRASTIGSSLEAETDSGAKKSWGIPLLKLVNNQDDAEMFDVNDLHGEDVFVEKEVADKAVSAAGEVNVASIARNVSAAATITTKKITLAQALVEIKTSKPKAKWIILQEPSECITTTTKIISSKQSQDKGKGIMVEESIKLKKKDQIRLDEEAAIRLQVELQAEFKEEQRLAREKAKKEQEANIALIETCDVCSSKN